ELFSKCHHLINLYCFISSRVSIAILVNRAAPLGKAFSFILKRASCKLFCSLLFSISVPSQMKAPEITSKKRLKSSAAKEACKLGVDSSPNRLWADFRARRAHFGVLIVAG